MIKYALLFAKQTMLRLKTGQFMPEINLQEWIVIYV